MSEAQQIALTAAVTLLGGMVLFMASEFIRVLVIRPMQDLREHIQLTLDRVDFYSNRLTNMFPTDLTREEQQLVRQIKGDLRSAATQLRSKYAAISLRELLVRLRLIPSADRIKVAYGALMYLQNSILHEGYVNRGQNPSLNHRQIERIETALTNMEIPILEVPDD